MASTGWWTGWASWRRCYYSSGELNEEKSAPGDECVRHHSLLATPEPVYFIEAEIQVEYMYPVTLSFFIFIC